MKKIFDSKWFYPQEDLCYYFDPERDQKIEWGEPPTEEELIELFEEWPKGTSLGDVFPHCKLCFKYPIIEDNVYLYRLLTESKDFKGLFDPLDYFNLLYEHLIYCLENINKDVDKVVKHLVWTNVTRRKLHFLLFSLHYLIKGLNGSVTADRIWPEGVSLLKNEKLGSLNLGIIDEYQILEKEFGIETENTDLPNVRGVTEPLILSNGKIKEGVPKRLTHPQIALIYLYEGKSINYGNCSEIANNYGFFNPKSGEGLRQDYEFFRSEANRLSVPETKKKFKNKITLFESIITHLKDKALSRVQDEIKILKDRGNNSDW